MYVSPNFKTKKALKEAIAVHTRVAVFSPGPFPAPINGETAIEGPHYPQPHRWYARVRVVDGCVAEVLK